MKAKTKGYFELGTILLVMGTLISIASAVQLNLSHSLLFSIPLFVGLFSTIIRLGFIKLTENRE